LRIVITIRYLHNPNQNKHLNNNKELSYLLCWLKYQS